MITEVKFHYIIKENILTKIEINEYKLHYLIMESISIII